MSGEVSVHPTVRGCAQAAAERRRGGSGISFLKEQQWSLEFGTALVQEQALRESFACRRGWSPARWRGRRRRANRRATDREWRLDAWGLGSRSGQELARLLPPPAVPGDLPQLQRARAEAPAGLALATRDRERAERLTTAGAAPEKRLDEARAAEAQARAGSPRPRPASRSTTSLARAEPPATTGYSSCERPSPA